MTREYRTAAAFKQALEQRLRTASTSGVDFARRRQLVVFDRFLARIALELGDTVTLKGGLAVELRIERARTTTLDEAFEAERAFLDPVLAGLTDSRWDPHAWSWVAPPAESDTESD